jgi:ABC-type glycerol-3-phosphate transport system substrate-binding protein
MDEHTTAAAITRLVASRYTRRRMLGMAAVGAGGAILAACGGSSSNATPTVAATSTGGAKVVITTPTAAAAAPATAAGAGNTSPAGSAAAAPTTSAASAAAPAAGGSPTIAVTRAELKGKVTIARQPASPLSNGKDDPGNIVFQQLIDRYVKEHPGVSMEWVRVPGSAFDELYQWVTTRQAAKNVPGIVASHNFTNSAQETTNTSPWVDVSPYLEKNSAYTNKPWKQDFPDDVLVYMRASNKDLYSVTFTAYKAAWLYNKNLWTKAGLTEADEPKTWVDFFKVLDKLKASGTIPIARTGDAFALSHAYWVTLNSVGRKAWLEMSGGKLFADAKTQYTALCTGKWKADTPWNRKTAEVTKRLFQYWPTGSTSLKASDVEQLFLTQKAVLWQGTPGNQGQTILRRVDEAKSEGLETFDVGAFPTPQPDAETFGADIAANAAPIADDGERGIEYGVPIPDLRLDKDPGVEAIAIDWMQWMTTPEIQAIQVKPTYDLPINPNVKLDDPRLQLFSKSKNQLFPAYSFYGDRPTWLGNFQAYLLGQKDLDTYIKDEQAEMLNYTQQQIRATKLDVPCG